MLSADIHAPKTQGTIFSLLKLHHYSNSKINGTILMVFSLHSLHFAAHLSLSLVHPVGRSNPCASPLSGLVPEVEPADIHRRHSAANIAVDHQSCFAAVLVCVSTLSEPLSDTSVLPPLATPSFPLQQPLSSMQAPAWLLDVHQSNFVLLVIDHILRAAVALTWAGDIR